jgi:hypothetical protein
MTTITYRRFNSYEELSKSIEIPSVQRNLIPKNVESIRKYIQECRSSRREPILGTIDLVTVRGDGKLYLVDGQHRMTAIQQEYIENKAIIPIHTMVYFVETYQEIPKVYQVRNAGIPVPEYYLSLSSAMNVKKKLIGEIEEYLATVPTFKRKSSARPYVSIENFMESFVNSKIFSICGTIQDFIRILGLINQDCYNRLMYMDAKEKKKLGISDKMMSVWENTGVYVGYNLNFPYFTNENIDLSKYGVDGALHRL